jgi:formylglycine-generating enzyme required for sulfatase activity
VKAGEDFQTPAPQAYNIDDPGQPKPPIKKGKSVRLWVAAFAIIVLLVVGAVVLIPMLNPTTLTLSNGIEFVKIPAGEFDMGSNEAGRSYEGPVHHVKISSAFYMGKYEVTQKQWRDVMGTNPSYFKGDNLPVENVSWNE